MTTPLSKRKQIYIIGIIILWATVIFLKQGGQSLLVHYLWPFIVLGSLPLLFRKQWFKNKITFLHIIAMLAIGVFFLTFITDLTPSDGSLELMNVSGGMLLAIILNQEKWDKKTLTLLFIGMIVVVSIVDVWGIINYALGHPFNRLAGPLIKPHEAFAGYPNLAANLNLMVLIPAFYLFVKNINKKGIIKISFFIVNILVVASLLLTYSRAALISAGLIIAIAAVILLIKYRKDTKNSLKFIASAVSIVLISILITATINGVRSANEQTVSIQDKLAFQSEDEGSSIDERIASFTRGINMALSNPIHGVGAGSFNYISQSYEQNFYTLSSYPYSLPIKIVAEHGVIMFSLLLIWIIGLIVIGLRSKNTYTFIATLTVGILLLHHCIDNNLDFFAASLPFFILLGMIWKTSHKKSIIKNYWLLLILLIVSLSGILFAFHEGWYGRYYIQARNAAGAGQHEEAYEGYLKADKLLFSRDAKLASALSALQVYKNVDQAGWLEKAKHQTLEYLETKNPLDRRGILLLANIHLEQNNYSECVSWTRLARIIGGENYFETDYYELICLQKLGETEKVKGFAINIKPKLEKYLELLKVNAHMTILTDNPKFAINILDILRKDYYDEFENLYEETYATATNELQKFHKKYNIEAEIAF